MTPGTNVSGKALAVLAGMLLWAAVSAAQQPAAGQRNLTELQRRINSSIERGAAFLRTQQARDGGFGVGQFRDQPGNSALCVLALRKSGAKVEDPAIKRCIPFLMKYAGLNSRVEDKHAVYNCGTTLLALDSLGTDVQQYGKTTRRPFNRRAMQKLGGTLKVMQAADGGWGYLPQKSNDLSNTQYALLGLWAAGRNGINVPKQLWANASRYVLAHQRSDGGFVYSNKQGHQTRAMTAAGIGSLAICYLQVKGDRLNREDIAGSYLSEVDTLLQPGDVGGAKPPPKRVTKAELAIEAAFKWFETRGLLERDPYYMYGMERACALTKTQKIGQRSWYEALAASIVAAQLGNGSWVMKSVGNDNDPILTTCWNLLVLCRATEQMFGDYPQGKKEYYSSVGEADIAPIEPGTPATAEPATPKPAPPEPSVPPASQRPSMVVAPAAPAKLPDGATPAGTRDELSALKEYVEAGNARLAEKLIDAMVASGTPAPTEDLRKVKAHLILGNRTEALDLVNKMLAATGSDVVSAPAPAQPATPRPTTPPDPAATTPPKTPKPAPKTDEEKAAKLVKLARNYIRLGMKTKADKYLSEVITKYPSTPQADKALKMRNSLFR